MQMRLSSTGLAVTGALSSTGNTTVGAAAAGTNRTLNINGVVSKAARIAFQESGVDRWLIGNGAASENGNFEIYDATNGNNFTITRAGNVGIGVTPSAWSSGTFGLEIGLSGSLSNIGTTTGVTVGANVYYNSAWKYKNTGDLSTLYEQYNGAHKWYTAASGTAGNAISFTQAMTLNASGQLGIGFSTPISGAMIDVRGANQNDLTDLGAQLLTLFDTTSYAANVGAGIAFGYKFNSSGSYIQRGAIIKVVKENATDNNYASALVFATTANAVASAERMRIDSRGYLLLGKTVDSVASNGFVAQPNGYISCSLAGSTSATDTLDVYSTGAAAYRFYVDMGGTIHATNTTISGISDQRLKEKIVDLDDGLNAVMALKPRKFDWKAGKGKDIKNDRGFIAQEFETVFPDLIDTWKDEAPEGEEPYKSVRADLIPVIVKALQELNANLVAQVAALSQRLAALESN
jgi:hypothetical protein